MKARDIEDAYFDSRRWDRFLVREGDVVVATYPKVGTTWMQQIVWQLIHGGPPGVGSLQGAAWLDMRIIPFQVICDTYGAQPHRRSIKTHLPLDALTFSRLAKYVVVGRDVRDMVWSAYNHQASYSDEDLALLNGPPGRPGALVSRPDRDVRDYYLHFLEHDDLPGFGFEPFWPHIQGWWNARALPNVLLVHYAELQGDLGGAIRRVAAFLGIDIDETLFPTIVEHCGFDYMRASVPPTNRVMFHKGVMGRWKDVLTPAEIALCDAVAARRLTSDCAHWLATGVRQA